MIKILTPPQIEPVTVEQVKSHLRLIHSQDDDLLALMITSARERVESFLSQGLIQQQVLFSSSLPLLKRGGLGRFSTRSEKINFRIPWGPLMDLENITLVGARKRMSIPLDKITVQGSTGWISFSCWIFMDQSINVTYQAGYGATIDQIPAAFKEAILELVLAKYERRLSFASQNDLLHDLLTPYRLKEI